MITGFMLGLIVMAAIWLASLRIEFDVKIVADPGHTLDGCLTKTSYERGDVIVSLGGRFYRLFRANIDEQTISDSKPEL
jgi:hypothetical protein